LLQLQLPVEQPPEPQAPPAQFPEQFPSQGLHAPQLLAEPVRPQPQPQSATGPS
jgi:hypothetical protein